MPDCHQPEGSRNSPDLMHGPYAAMPGMSASITSFLRVAASVNAKRLISIIPPSVAKDLVRTTVTAQGIAAKCSVHTSMKSGNPRHWRDRSAPSATAPATSRRPLAPASIFRESGIRSAYVSQCTRGHVEDGKVAHYPRSLSKSGSRSTTIGRRKKSPSKALARAPPEINTSRTPASSTCNSAMPDNRIRFVNAAVSCDAHVKLRQPCPVSERRAAVCRGASVNPIEFHGVFRCGRVGLPGVAP